MENIDVNCTHLSAERLEELTRSYFDFKKMAVPEGLTVQYYWSPAIPFFSPEFITPDEYDHDAVPWDVNFTNSGPTDETLIRTIAGYMPNENKLIMHSYMIFIT